MLNYVLKYLLCLHLFGEEELGKKNAWTVNFMKQWEYLMVKWLIFTLF